MDEVKQFLGEADLVKRFRMTMGGKDQVERSTASTCPARPRTPKRLLRLLGGGYLMASSPSRTRNGQRRRRLQQAVIEREVVYEIPVDIYELG
jgi:hypothetical protein